MRKLWCLGLALLMVLGVSIAQPSGITGESVPSKQPVSLDLTWQIKPREPIPFKPFEMVDPATGLPVEPYQTIVVDGVKWLAGEYYALLNHIEAELSKLGYSLRDEADLRIFSPELTSEIAESERRRLELEAQMPIAGEPFTPNGLFFPAACREVGRAFDPGWFGSRWLGLRPYGDGVVRACFNNNTLSLTAQGRALLEARLARRVYSLADANLQVYGSATTQNRVQVEFSGTARVLDRVVWRQSNRASSNGPWSRTFDVQLARLNETVDIDWGRFDFLGIATVRLLGRGGIEGQLNLRAEFEFSIDRQRAAAIASGNLTGYAELLDVQFDIGVAELRFWVEGRLTLLSGSLKGAARGLFYPNTRQLHATIGLFPELTALSGRIDACVRAKVLGARKTKRFELFDWDGLRWSGDLGRYDVVWQL